MSNVYGVAWLLLAVVLVVAFYGGILWLHRIASGRRLRSGRDAIASAHTSAAPDLTYLHGDSTHSIDSSFHEGGGEFGGAGASESYESGGDSGDGGGDGGGD